MKITPADRVHDRLKSAERSFETLKRKVYNLRRVVAGDFSKVMGDAPAAKQDGPEEDQFEARDFYDFIVTDIKEGRSNKLLKAVKTIRQQVAFTFPEIEAEDLPPEIAAILSGWCKARLGDAPRGCGANEAMALALTDYLVGGVGFVKACWRDRVDVLHCDALNMKYDRSAGAWHRQTWRSCTFRMPKFQWAELYDDFDWTDIGGDSEDGIIAVEMYYDVEGEAGSHYVLIESMLGEEGGIVYQGENPYYDDTDGTRRPFLPYIPLHYLTLPSVSAPIGIVDTMLPAQVAKWESENAMRENIKRGVAFIEAEAGSLGEAQRKQLEEGEIAAVIEREQGFQAIINHPPLEVSSTHMAWDEKLDRELIDVGGTNPYIGGAPQGVNYAREVDEIAGQSGLTTSTVSKDWAQFWVRVVKACLGIGKAYDDLPLTILIDGVPVSFDAIDPVKDYLFPAADIVVREDSTTFRPRQQKMAEAMTDIATVMPIAGQFPNALPLAFESYVRAKGEQNVQKWIERPAIDPATAAVMGAAPAEAPPDAAASTA